MTDKERFLNEVKEVKLIIQANRAQGAFSEGYLIGQESVLEHFEKFIDSMQEESDGDDLGVIATRDALAYANDIEDECINIADVVQAYEDGMIAGAQWQKQQMMKDAVDSIVHCDKFGVILPKEDLKKAVDNLPELQVYDKVKLLIIKED